jgi:putative Ca2+/H+ antiporter (TMEM165/GDT1 family)
VAFTPLSHKVSNPMVTKKTDSASLAMSASDVVACFIGTFLGLVAAALLIAVLGLI